MDDLVAMLRELNPLLGHGGGKTVNEAADAIERLSAERDKLKHDLKMAFSEDDKLIVMKQMQTEINAYKERIAELEKDKADFHMQYRMKCDEETKRLELRIAALESGQPCEVGGITGQWVPKVLTGAMQRAGYFRDWEANQTVWQSQLTASAQEMKKPQPPETPK